MKLKNFFKILLSDSNKISSKRFIGVICLFMFVLYGIAGLFKPFDVNFWIFYVSLSVITVWIAFRFMSSDKILKYDVISKLTKFSPLKEAVKDFITNEDELDQEIQPEIPSSGDTKTEKTKPLSEVDKTTLGD